MKYDILYNWISPVTGKIVDYTQLPDLPTGDIWIGDINSRPTPSGFTPVSNVLQKDYTFLGNKTNISQPSPILIDIRLDILGLRKKLNSLDNPVNDATYILQIPNSNLPNAQALNALLGGILKSDTDGVVSIALADVDYMAGITSSTTNAIVRFLNTDGKSIKDSKVTIDDSGELYANSLHVTNLIGKNTGFNASTSMLLDVLYSLPTTAGFPTQMLTTPGITLTGSYQLYWSTPPSQITTDNPYEPDKPYPVYTPIPIPIPIPTPYPVPVFIPIPGLPLGGVTASPVSIDPTSGNIDTPGDLNANDINGNDANFDGDVDIDGDLSTEGSINADGSVSGDSFNFEDQSDLSDNYIQMDAPFDLDHNFEIELPDAEPIMQEVVQPPDQRILQTAWRRVRPESEIKAKSKNGKELVDILPITKMTWTELLPSDPISLTFVPATSTTNEQYVIGFNGSAGGTTITEGSGITVVQNTSTNYIISLTPLTNSQLVDLVESTLINFPMSISGTSSFSKINEFKIQTNYNLNAGDTSTSLLSLNNRVDNGYGLKSNTQYGLNPDFSFIQKLGTTINTLWSYSGTSNSFSYLKPINMGTNTISSSTLPTLPQHFANKAYVDSHGGGGGTVTSITLGTGLSSPSGATITTSGTINLANTTVTAGTYRLLANTIINPQGQITSASNGSPISTTTNAIATWGNNAGTSLINTSVTIDTAGNIAGSGSATFLFPQVSSADGIGALSFLSGSFSLQLRLNGALTNNRLWFLPTNNALGFFKNNGSGTISWSTLSSSDISNFSTTVTAFRLDQFAIPTVNLNLNNKNITNLADPINAQDAATMNYVDSQITNTGNITFSGDNIDSTTQGINFVASNVDFYQTTQFHNGIHVGPTYVSFARADPSTIFVFPLGGSLFVDLQSRLCFKDKNGNVAVIVTP
jgi:hypothetical protein